MRQLLLLAAALLLVPAASAQTFEWVHDADFNSDLDAPWQQTSAHGLAVDPDGKLWIQHFGAKDSVQVDQFAGAGDPDGRDGWRDTRVLYILNPDGTQASFSPLKVLTDDGGAAVDTLGGFVNSSGVWEGRSGRGLGLASDGNILASQFDTLFKIDYKTGEFMAKAAPFAGQELNTTLTSAMGAGGSVFVSSVFAGPDRMVELDGDDLSQVSVVGTSHGFNRSHLALDENTVISFDYTIPYSNVASRDNSLSPWNDSTFSTFYGMAIESTAINPDNGQVWVSAGSAGDTPNRSVAFTTAWKSHTWYAFEPADLLTQEVPTPQDSLTWFGCDNFTDFVCDSAPEPTIGKPRGIAISPDGQTIYVGNFSQLIPSVQKFTRQEIVAAEPSTLADGTTLEANAPNPFQGSTTIRFELANAADVAVRVYDVMGREVATLVEGPMQAGPQSATFDASGLAAGTYLYTLEVDGQRLARRMLLAR